MPFLPLLKRTAVDFLFPMRCAGCAKEGSFLCSRCKDALAPIPPSCMVCKRLRPAEGRVVAGRTCKSCRKKSKVFAFFSPYLYQDKTIRDLIHHLKYQRVREIRTVLADLILRSLNYFAVKLPPEGIIIPIPLYPSRERVRGFNQSALIAEALCPTLGVGQRADILRKTKKTAPQMELSAEKRRTNLIGTFAVTDPTAIKDKIVILLDDVKTTGATLEEAARVLRSTGAKRVWAVTVAH